MHTETGIHVVARGAGDKTPVVLVHGAWHGAWCWEGNYLDQFAAAGHPVKALDLRGNGESRARGAMRWNRISGYADDIAEVVALCPRPPVVVGHSMGGFALQHAMARGVKMAGACLLASAPQHGVWRTSLHILRTRPITFAKINLLLSLWPVVSDAEAAHALLVEPDAAPEVKARLTENLGDEAYLAFLDMLALNLPRKPDAPPPVLIVGGEEDAIFSVKEQQSLQRRFDAPMHILPQTPHNIMMSRASDRSGQIILDWMAEIA